MKDWGCTNRFPEHFKIAVWSWNYLYEFTQVPGTWALAPEIAYLGFLSIRNSILTMKTRADHIFRVYKSTSEKVLIFSHDLVIANSGVIRYQELNNEQENALGLTIEGLHVDAKQCQLKPSIIHPDKFYCSYLSYWYLRTPKICNHRIRGKDWHFSKNRQVDPQYVIWTSFHGQNWAPNTLKPPNMQYQA